MRAPAFLVATGILGSRIAGLIRQLVFAHQFGTSFAADAFTAAMRIPNFLQTMFGEGVLSASFIPVYSRLLGEGKDDVADRAAGAVGALLAVVTAGLVLVGVLIAPLLVWLIVPGFTGETRELTILLVRILFPGIGLLVMAAWCLAILNSRGRFLLSYSAPILWNAAIIVAILIFRRQPLDRLAIYTAIGAVVGSLLQLAVQVPTVLTVAPRLRLSFDTTLEPVRTALRNFTPAAVARGVVQISAFVDEIIASLVAAGAVAALGYAQVLYMLPVSLFGMSVSAAELPQMSRAAAGGDTAAFADALRVRLGRALRFVAVFVIPSAVAFIALGDIVISMLFERGAFDADDVRYVWAALLGAGVALPASTLGRLYASTFFALHDTRTPLRFAVARVLVGAAIGAALALLAPRVLEVPARWGIAGITLGSAVGAWFELGLLARALDTRIGRVRPAAGVMLRVVGAAMVAAVAAVIVRTWVDDWHPILRGMLVLGVFGAAYFGLADLLEVGELRDGLRRLRNRGAPPPG